MIENKNALAELAECIKNADIQIGKMAGCSFECIRNAQRIVAELAKVEDRHDGETNSDVLWRCNDCIAKCRAIAEEGVNNGK